MPMPEREFTAEEKKHIEQLAKLRVPQRIIASVVKCTEKTLRKHAREILDAAYAEADTKLTAIIYDEAVNKRQKWALQMLAKWYCGYREPPRELHAQVNAADLLAELKEADDATFVDADE